MGRYRDIIQLVDGKAIVIDPKNLPSHIADISDQAYNFSFEREVFDLTNEYRISNGVAPLLWDDDLAATAREHSMDLFLNNLDGHIGSDGSTLKQRLLRRGITDTATENVATRQMTPAEAFEAWLSSPGHRANILNPKLDYLGVGFYNYYWTQDFLISSYTTSNNEF